MPDSTDVPGYSHDEEVPGTYFRLEDGQIDYTARYLRVGEDNMLRLQGVAGNFRRGAGGPDGLLYLLSRPPVAGMNTTAHVVRAEDGRPDLSVAYNVTVNHDFSVIVGRAIPREVKLIRGRRHVRGPGV